MMHDYHVHKPAKLERVNLPTPCTGFSLRTPSEITTASSLYILIGQGAIARVLLLEGHSS